MCLERFSRLHPPLHPSSDEIKEEVIINDGVVYGFPDQQDCDGRTKKTDQETRASNSSVDVPLFPCPKCH